MEGTLEADGESQKELRLVETERRRRGGTVVVDVRRPLVGGRDGGGSQLADHRAQTMWIGDGRMRLHHQLHHILTEHGRHVKVEPRPRLQTDQRLLQVGRNRRTGDQVGLRRLRRRVGGRRLTAPRR